MNQQRPSSKVLSGTKKGKKNEHGWVESGPESRECVSVVGDLKTPNAWLY
jgi:hypothetical protein